MRTCRTHIDVTWSAGDICRMSGRHATALSSAAPPWRAFAGACATIAVGCTAYGFVFGVWRSPLQGVYSGIKLPLLFFAVVAASALINTMLAQVMGARLSFRQVIAVMLAGMAVTAAIIGGLAPVAMLFVLNVSSPEPSLVCGDGLSQAAVEAMRDYRMLLLGHVSVLAVAGLAGNLKACRLLRRITSPRGLATRLMIVWIVVAGFVGCELSWLFSPFLCKPTQPPHMLAREYFQENFYERVWHVAREALP